MNIYFFLFIVIIVAIASLVVEATKRRTANPTPSEIYTSVFFDDKEIKITSIEFLPRNMVKITSEDKIYLTSTNKCVFVKNK